MDLQGSRVLAEFLNPLTPKRSIRRESRSSVNIPTDCADDHLFSETPSKVGLLTCRESRSPMRASSSRHSRHNVTARHDLAPTISSTSTTSTNSASSSIKRKKSASVSTSVAVTARSSFVLEDLNPVRETGTRTISTMSEQIYKLPNSFIVPERRISTPEDISYVPNFAHSEKANIADPIYTSQNSYSSRRHNAEQFDESHRTKHERFERHPYSGPIAHAEFERMKKEIESLKKSLHDNKKTVKKQAKKIDELKSQLVSETLAKMEQETQVQILRSKCEKKEELIATVESSLQCQICMDLFHKPFALSPCGHILCLHCLQEWFKRAPPSADDADLYTDDLADDPHYILNRPKSCPCCRAVVTHRPAPVFTVKSMASALVKARGDQTALLGGKRSPSPYGDEDPWKGIFRSTDESESEESDDEEFEDAVGWALHGLHGFEFHDDSSSMSDSDDEDGDQDESDPQSDVPSVGDDDADDGVSEDHDGVYVPARWEPPATRIDPEELAFEDSEDSEMILSMLRRGCTNEMIQTFSMEYTHRGGLVAHLHSLDELYAYADEDPDDTSIERANRIFLGWNIKVDDTDLEGETYMQQVLNNLRDYPERWQVEARRRRPGSFDVKRMVRLEDVEDYDTTDSEVWLGGGD